MGGHDLTKRSPRIVGVIVVCHLGFLLCPLVKHDMEASISGIKEMGDAFHRLVKARMYTRLGLARVSDPSF